MSKLFSKRLFIYEIKTILLNWYIPFFGVIFPILLSQILGRTAFVSGVPENMVPYIITEAYFNFILIIPLCVVMLGHASMYSQDLEHGIPQRMKLFGISLRKQLCVRLVAIMLIDVASIIFFTLTYALSFRMLPATLSAILTSLLVLTVVSVALFLIAHAIALLFKKFEPTYGASMGLYFFFMITGGAMGIRPNQFPPFLKFIAQLFPFYHASGDLGGLFYKSVNLAPMFQSLIFFLFLSIVLLLLALHKNKKSFR